MRPSADAACAGVLVPAPAAPLHPPRPFFFLRHSAGDFCALPAFAPCQRPRPFPGCTVLFFCRCCRRALFLCFRRFFLCSPVYFGLCFSLPLRAFPCFGVCLHLYLLPFCPDSGLFFSPDLRRLRFPRRRFRKQRFLLALHLYLKIRFCLFWLWILMSVRRPGPKSEPALPRQPLIYL